MTSRTDARATRTINAGLTEGAPLRPFAVWLPTSATITLMLPRGPRGRTGRHPELLLAHAAVDLLAEKVRVAVVPRVLLDHVHKDPAKRDRPPVALVARDAEVVNLPHEAIRDLRAPDLPRLSHDRRVGYGSVEVPVGFGVGIEVRRRVLPGHDPTEPDALHLGHVAY